jgi:hypothetical protein
VEEEPLTQIRVEALHALEQIEFPHAQAERMVAQIFSQNKNLRSVEEFLRKVFEERET